MTASVAILTSNTPLGRSSSPSLARTTIRRISSAPSLGDLPLGRRSLSSPQCGLPAGAHEALEQHVARCPNGGARHLMHHGIIKTLRGIMIEESKVPKVAILKEAK